MITAIDTSVLLDVFGADATFGDRSRAALQTCLSEGGLVSCDVVWAEVAGVFPTPAAAIEAFDLLGVSYDPLGQEAALAAARVWKSYRTRGGPRSRVVADFLIGAHASEQAERLLTRDRGFYRTCFPRLTVIDPAS